MQRRSCIFGTLLVASLLAAPADAGCPPAGDVLARIAQLPLERGSRATRFASPLPKGIYEKAMRKPGQPVVERQGKKGFGILLAEVPLRSYWIAVNDEEHHQDFTPVVHSEVIGGEPRGTDRLVFQYAKMLGLGRWWVTHVRMNVELFDESGGTIWEVWWQDELDAADRDAPPISEVSHDIRPIESSRGSWLLTPIAEGCTLVELFSWSEAGGGLGALEGLAVERSLRNTMNGMLRAAREHAPVDHATTPFYRPDGTLLGPPTLAATAGAATTQAPSGH